MNQTASLWILKKYSVTRLADRVRCSILFATDAGARLSTILIDYSSVSIEVLQVALSLKSFNPLIRIFIFAKSGYPLSELESSLAIVLGAEFITSFAGLSAALARGPRWTSPPPTSSISPYLTAIT
jgi:hypothetical protein